MAQEAVWELIPDERTTLSTVLDLLLPPTGSFPLPSETRIIDDFILKRVPVSSNEPPPYPGLDSSSLKAMLGQLAGDVNESSLQHLEHDRPADFQALWSLAVYGYYSRPETIDAMQRDLATEYHGAPLPQGYDHVIEPWDPDDPLQFPRQAPGTYIKTEDVRRVDTSALDFESDQT